MNEEEKTSVETPVEETQAAAPAAESENVNEVRQETAEERRKRNDVEYNWAEARRKMQELDRRVKEQDDYISKLKQTSAPKDDYEEIDRLTDDDIVTKAQARKLAEKMAKQIASQVIKEREAATVEERVKLRFNDFDDVVTQENIELLKQKKPELASSVASNPDPYAQAVAAYDALKMIGAQEMSKTSVEKEKALKNAQKPLSVNAVTKQSAIGNAHLFENGLTPELKKQLLKEMQEASKRA